jgi:hypothetical protein
MASDTVPAAVPGPGDPADTPQASPQTNQARGFAGLLSAVDPARSAFDLNPTLGTPAQDTTKTESAGSSADYHNTENPQENSTKNSSSTNARQERGVIRAWLLAGAERWRKGGDARLKALDIKKARAAAFQVKEARTVNRSEKIVGGSTNTGTNNQSNAGKTLDNKASKKDSSSGPKNSSDRAKNGPAGRSGNSGAAGSGGGAGGRGTTNGPSGSKTGAGTSGGRSTDTKGAGSPGPSKTDNAKPDKDPKGPKGPTASGGGSKGGEGGKPGPKGPAGRSGKDGNAGDGASNDKTKPGAGPSAGNSKKTAAGDDASKKTDLEKKDGKKDGKTDPAKQAPSKGPENPDKSRTDLTKTDRTKTPGTGKRLNVQPSREAGYRDGTRAATVAAHVSAWRDGTKDGWADTQQAATREKHRLDKAHQQRKQEREKDQPVTGASSADYHPAPAQTAPQTGTQPHAAPVEVTGIDATHIQLGDGAARTHISRGEVRSLRKFQQTLQNKTNTMTRVADATRTLEAHANEQVRKVTTLLEQAKAVKGGDKLVTALTKLEDAAKVQAGHAAEIHKRAVRAAEACKALHANTETRYGGIYKAVVDSPLTAPAEMMFYKEMAHAG